MDVNEKFNAFLDKLKTEENSTIIESVREAYSTCFEAGLNMSNLGGTHSMDSSVSSRKTLNNATYNKSKPLTDEEKAAREANEKRDQMLIRRKTSSLTRTFRNVAQYALEHPEIVEKMYKTILQPAIKEGYAKMDEKLGTDTSGKSFGSRLKRAIGAFRGEGVEGLEGMEDDPETLTILESLAYSNNLVNEE